MKSEGATRAIIRGIPSTFSSSSASVITKTNSLSMTQDSMVVGGGRIKPSSCYLQWLNSIEALIFASFILCVSESLIPSSSATVASTLSSNEGR